MNYNELAKALTIADPSNFTWNVGKEQELVRNDGLSLWFREGGYGNKGKIAIHFSRPAGRGGHQPTLWMPSPATGQILNPSINVSATKSEAQIAKDIVRRLLPEAEVVFKLAHEAIARDNAYLDGKTFAIETLANVVGAKPERHYQSKELTGEIDPYKGAGLPSFQGAGYGKFKVSSKDSITLELTSMNLDVAIEIAEAVQAVFAKRSKQ